MTAESFRAILLSGQDGNVRAAIETLPVDQLPAGDTLVAVSHSTLNYKDGMILKGQGRLVRTYPHVPGVDFAGTVIETTNQRLRPGDRVVSTGWRVGEERWGGYATRARVPGEWLVKLPDTLSEARAMAIGTAGFTSMLAIMALEAHGLKPGPEVLVTGAAGGVGSVAVALLSRLGHTVVASTGRAETEGTFLTGLGAKSILPRAELEAAGDRPLRGERFGGVVDAVGGKVLAGALPQLRYRASVAACGLAGGAGLTTTIIPFLLRGVNLLGIDSVMSPLPERETAWRRIAETMPVDVLDRLTQTVGLADVIPLADEILAGRVRGRVVVAVER